ncbi:conserved hypothetical protein [Ricinus communis]|uniref:Uncharacterized protein n=1 Tax=Ricinus communis TaxID=3988 RepID=B9TCN1_RICCO|nr:conserved hypothetical protein [Ricinus communis]
MRDEGIGRPAAHFRRVRIAGDILVVIPDHGQVAGHLQVAFAGRVQRADRHQVVRAEQRGGPLRQVEQGQCVFVAGRHLPVARAHEDGIERDVGRRQRLAIPLQALGGRLDPVLAVDEADAAVPVLDQVHRGRIAAQQFARHDGRAAAVARVAVQQHGRRIGQRSRHRHGTGEDRGIDDAQQCRMAQHACEHGRFHVGVAPCGEHGHETVVFPGGVLGAVDGLHRVRARRQFIGQVDDQVARLHGGVVRMPFDGVAELTRDPQHGVARDLRHLRPAHVVDHQRHRRLRHAGQLGDVGHRGSTGLGHGREC